MRTKLSKRILSVLLAALMVVTSVPLMSFSAFAAETDAITDPEVLAAQEAMQAFADKLATEGAAYSNVEPAYNAYVDVQEAIDAYYYGGADVSTLHDAVDALNTASDQMTDFTGYTGTAIPTFPNSTADDMREYAGAGFNNVLYASQATAVTTGGPTGGVQHNVYYAPDAVLLYDGQNDVILPVMMSANKDNSGNAHDKNRYIWSCYPSDSSGNDDADWALVGQWQSGNGNDANWNWNWWSGLYNNTNSHAGYNRATGYEGTFSTSMRSGAIPNSSSEGALWWVTYYAGAPLYMSNALKLNTVPDDYNDEYTLYWYTTTGGDNNADDSTVQASSSIKVINYKTLTDAIAQNGSKMKSIDLKNYSEGGLSAYIQAMDTATSFDPNSYFTSGDGSAACVSNMRKAVSAVNSASTTNTNSAEYAALRAAMDAKMAAYNNGVNEGYTEDSYSELAAAYEEAMRVMAAVASSGYTDTQGAQTAADALNAVDLVTDAEKVDTAALEAVIDEFESYANIFTAETYAQATQTVNDAKTAVWGSADRYKDAASALDESEENIAIVSEQITAVENAVRGLRIDPDTVLITQYGRYSMNSAIALKDTVEDSSVYYNWATYETAVNAALDYIDLLAVTELTDYDTQYADYLKHIEDMVAAYEALEYAFTLIPNGTVAVESANTDLPTLSYNDQGSQRVDFSYPNGATIFKTTHDGVTAKYGEATIRFSTTYADSIGGVTLQNNMLDSITLNAGSTNDNSIHYLTDESTLSGFPSGWGLSDAQKQTYAGSLVYNNGTAEFSLSNLKYAGRNNYNDADRILTLSDGTQITDEIQAMNTDLTGILGTTDGADTNPARGGVFAHSTDGSNFATVDVSADMNITIPADTNVQELSADTIPESTTTVLNTYFGAVTARNLRNTTQFAGYTWFTSAANNNSVVSSVVVIDVSYLFDLIEMCDTLVADSAKYTDDSWSTFVTALEAAKEPLDYSNMNSATILLRCKTRYTNLWNAYQDLEIKTLPVTFNYKDTDASDASAVINVEYGKTLTDYADQINTIDYPETYVSADGVYTYTFINWSPEVDLDTPVTAARTYTAQYESQLNKADFTEYNNATAQLLGALVDEVYSVSDLEAIKSAIDGMTYYDMPEDERDELMGDVQASINAEKDAIDALREGLTPAEVDIDAAKAAAEEAKAGKDEDVYDLSTLDFNYTSVVNVGGQDVVGLTFATQNDVDAAISEFLNNLNKNVYTIYLNGSPVGTAEYGTPVIVGSDGAFKANVTDIDSTECDGEKSVAWSYSYSAPSRDGVQTDAKYMLTAKAVGFIVKGNTYLTTANATSDEEGYVVKFATNGGKIFDVQYTTNGKVTVPDAPNYAFYTFTGYEGGYTAGQEIDVSADMTIVANYEADTSVTYNIAYYPNLSDWVAPTNMEINSYSYNELVALQKDDAYCWVSAYTCGPDYIYEYTLLAYGDSYSFYACRSYEDDLSADTYEGIVALTRSEYETLVSDTTSYLYDGAGNRIQTSYDDYARPIYPEVATVSVIENVVPVYDENDNLAKFSMIGTFTLPEDYSIVECGILFSSNQAADLTVENVGNDGVARMKSSSYTCGNQFVINVKAPSNGAAVNFKYGAYAIVKDADGNLTTLYSKSVMGTTEGF